MPFFEQETSQSQSLPALGDAKRELLVLEHILVARETMGDTRDVRRVRADELPDIKLPDAVIAGAVRQAIFIAIKWTKPGSLASLAVMGSSPAIKMR